MAERRRDDPRYEEGTSAPGMRRGGSEETREEKLKDVRVHSRREDGETNTLLKGFVQSQTCVFVSVFPIVTSPRDPAAQSAVKPSRCTSQLNIEMKAAARQSD